MSGWKIMTIAMMDDLLTDSLTGWLTDWLTDRLTDWVSDWVTDWLSDWLAYWVTDLLSDCLVDWLTASLSQWTSEQVSEHANERLTNVTNLKAKWMLYQHLISSEVFFRPVVLNSAGIYMNALSYPHLHWSRLSLSKYLNELKWIGNSCTGLDM